MSMFITNRAGTVHRLHPAGNCHAYASPDREPVTVLQALKYKLLPCGNCWASNGEYERAIGRRAAA